MRIIAILGIFFVALSSTQQVKPPTMLLAAEMKIIDALFLNTSIIIN